MTEFDLSKRNWMDEHGIKHLTTDEFKEFIKRLKIGLSDRGQRDFTNIIEVIDKLAEEYLK